MRSDRFYLSRLPSGPGVYRWSIYVPRGYLRGRERPTHTRRTFPEVINLMDFYIARYRAGVEYARLERRDRLFVIRGDR